jgi:hypothetical protein
MIQTRAGILLISGGAMALIWRFAVANYISLAAMDRPYPLAEAILAVTLAAVIGALTHRRGWRVISVVGLHGCIAALTLLRTIYVYRGGAQPFLSSVWLRDLIAGAPDAVEWFRIILVAGLAVWFWCGGWFLIRGKHRPQSHYTRLDLGLAFFFVLFLAKLVAWQKTGIEITDPVAVPSLIAFMLFGLLAVGLARRGASVRTQFVSGKKTVGMMVSVILVALLFSTGALVLFRPYLTAMAEVSYAVIKTVGAPIGAVLLTIVQFLFMPRRMRPDPPSTSSGMDIGPTGGVSETSGWGELIQKILAYGAAGVAVLMVLAAVALIVWMVARWLWSRTPRATSQRPGLDPWALWSAVREALRRFLVAFRKIVGGFFQGSPRSGAHLFGALSAWGRRSGISRNHWETPGEYGLRLKQRFPQIDAEIEILVELFNLEVYGVAVIGQDRLATARAAWRRLRAPRHWGRRLRSWFSVN